MKSLIIYCSNYKKNTEKIAKIFAEKSNSELINIKDIDNVDIESYDLIGFGSGVYKESMSPKIFKFADKLNVRGKNIFVFSTSGIGMKFYNNKLIKLLVSKGAINKGSFACKGSFVAKEFTNIKLFDIIGRLSQGHPNDKDLRKAEEFIETVVLYL
ncbi:flavodoxin domain-containing protein [Clostridium sp. BSD9I1]|uniref:flavodoxin domain-containing protein n=1 Tax=Clostridium sp. BSD9I1 TaxID=2003589 RepID=UPI00164780B6|nr:flavodoxin domain-containing protein [Clostridium sp. BSD9I1]